MKMLERAGAPLVTMPGLMMDVPLTIGGILAHAVRNHKRQEIVSRDGDEIVRFTYADFGTRTARLANTLARLGVRPGDRVASFAWNTHRHLELYYAVPAFGAVLHTVNIRLFPEQVGYVIAHADDKVIFVDGSLVPAIRKAIDAHPALASRTFVIMGAADGSLPHAHDYETLLADEEPGYQWPAMDERNAAMLCYTSATTGDPKAALFSHRSTYIHALTAGMADALAFAQRDIVLPIVPMFHVNAWGIPFLALLTGAKIVMPGAALDPANLIALIDRETVSFSAGVPTVWLAIRDTLRAEKRRLPSLERVVIGGSAIPPQLLDDLEEMGIRVIHAWGMTEMSPIGTVSPRIGFHDGSPAEGRAKNLKQGMFVPIVDWKVIDEEGLEVPQDGTSHGELWVRGPAVASAYYENPTATAASMRDGWFRTGDIVTVDPEGFMQIVDRAKDLVKSGGEWISSVELENLLMGHPHVKEACVFGVPHAKWIERPIAAVVVRGGHSLGEEDIRGWLGERVAKWMIPDRVVFIDAIPRTGVGKFLKRELRERYKDLLS